LSDDPLFFVLFDCFLCTLKKQRKIFIRKLQFDTAGRFVKKHHIPDTSLQKGSFGVEMSRIVIGGFFAGFFIFLRILSDSAASDEHKETLKKMFGLVSAQ